MAVVRKREDRKSTRLNSSHGYISYAVFCLKKKKHHAVEADSVEEGLGGGDRVLADHRVDDDEHLVGLHRVADVGCLLHQRLVDTETPGGVDDDDVVELAPGLLDRGARDVDRVARAFFFNDAATTEIYTLSLHDALPI